MGRLDQILVERGLCESREKAKRAIMAGLVRINQHRAAKASEAVGPTDQVTLEAPDQYVSRGGHKLAHALREFHLDPTGAIAIDLGASTGGFTDCLLQAGAARVYAVDVGQGQLAWKLRQDPRVIVRERQNARHLTRADLDPAFTPADIITIDCSFISLQKILPVATALAADRARIVALVKPQFEAGKAEADRGRGVITDPQVHERVLRELHDFCATLHGWRVTRTTESPILGPAGNKEFLILLENLDAPHPHGRPDRQLRET